ncbi:2-oxoglutarate dehydrogenase E2 component (dihydrolipoamide succinyltransferase) [Sphingobacterium paludis]|uniref:Dihydrolipoamide acetyltransferase component of pyruvate dehydrogenase complex n=2 Tax=Sphingobacterium paludis TaxID=1476465 RepID=A0A4R7CVL3_9SPHI|nr:2-oxoglutarate dehydrogenase E2 component (dihydrolipoamide succinyltransferase) [Sphingobacterium paludis]
MGESVSEATITKWVKSVGDTIEEDEAVVEIATDKVDSDVPSPVAGTLTKVLFEENQVVQVGDAIAWIETDSDDMLRDDDQDTPAFVNPGSVSDEEIIDQHTETTEGESEVQEIPGVGLLDEQQAAQNTVSPSSRFYSPLVKNIAQEEGISPEELDEISGSGADGRVTKQDVLDHLHNRAKSDAAATTPDPAPQAAWSADTTPVQTAVKSVSSGQDEIIAMDRMRKLIADHMVHSVKTSPHVASFVEADVTHLVNWRNKIKDSYKQREGENITFTPIFIEAISKAIKDFPMINVSVDGHNIIKRKHINIGMAAALPSGNLIVPVIKNADQLSLVGLSKAVNDLANRSRSNKLKPDDTQGGTFTFSNIGAFGNIMGFPIINQPQAAILAVGTIKKRPAVLETADGDVIAIRHMMYLSMSYDHRVIDGALGGTFLKRVADYLENWDTNREI